MNNNKKKIINLRITMLIVLIVYILIAFLVDTYIKNIYLLNTIMIISTIIFIVFFIILFKNELKIVDYECKNCKYIFKPEFKKTLFSPHIGTTRYLKCHKCNKRNWNKLIIK